MALRYLWAGAVACLLILPAALSAATLGPGCRASTPADLQKMKDLGLPQAYEVCPKDQAILGIGDNFEQWYAKLKSQSPCNKSICTLSCRTHNTGAQVCGPIAKKWNAIGCHPNNNTAIFPSDAYGFAAHIDLLRTYCGTHGRCTILSVVGKWAQTNAANQSTYANFVSKNAGIPINQVFDPNDIDLMGRLALAMSCMEAGSLPYNVADLKQGLVMAAGGPKVAVPPNVGQILQQSLQTPYSPSSPLPGITAPFFGENGPGASTANPQSSAPFSQPAPQPPPPQPPPQSSPQTQQTSAIQQFFQGLNGGQNNPTAATLSVSNPIANIIGQPPVVSLGSSFVVAWSTLGMSTKTPCQVFENTNLLLSQGNNGSKKINTNSGIAPGKLTFTLQCTGANGQPVQKTAQVTVK
jgi:hypothetical protein